MPLSFNGINQSNIAITGGVQFEKVTPKFFSGTTNSNPLTIGTVPALKKWTIIYLEMGVNEGSTAITQYFTCGGVQTLTHYAQGTATVNAIVKTNLKLPYNEGIVLTTGQTITLTTATAQTSYNVVYIEEDA